MKNRKPERTAAKPAAQVEPPGLRVPAPAAAALIISWLALAAYGYWGNLVLRPASLKSLAALLPEAVIQQAPALALRLAELAGLWLLAAALGALILKPMRVRCTRGESLLLASGLGFGTLSLALLALGLLGGFKPAALKLIFWAATAASLAAAPWWLRGLPDEHRPGGEGVGWRGGIALAVMAAATAMNALAAASPEIFYDSLVYHLALPKLYLLQGRIASVPYNIYSGLPLGMQMLYGLALAVCDEKLAALLHASFGLAGAGAVYLIGRRHIGAPAGAFAAFAFYLCPATLYASWGCGVDLGAAFFCAAAMLAILLDLEAEPGPGWPVCTGLLLGFACGTKYNVLPFAVVLGCVYAWQSRALGRPWRGSLLLAGSAAAAFAAWPLKNLLFFANPLYPFLRDLFGGGEWISDWKGFLGASGSRDLGTTLGSPAGWKELLLQPWTTSVGTWPMGDWPGALFIFLIPWVFLLRLRRRPVQVLAAAAAAGYLCWTLVSTLVRYLLPTFSYLSLLAALAVEDTSLPRWLRRVGWACALYAGLFNLQVAFLQGSHIGIWHYSLGLVSRSDYLKTMRTTYPLPYYAAAEFINRELPPGARVLVLGESRAYYIERDVIAATVFDHNPFWLAAAQARSAEELKDRVKAMGVTHVFLSARQFAYRSDSPGIFPREVAAGPVFTGFWERYLRPLYDEGEDAGKNPRWLIVYELLDSPNPKGSYTPNPAAAVLRFLERPGS